MEPLLRIGRWRKVEGHATRLLLARVGAVLQRLWALHDWPLAALPLLPAAHAVADVIVFGIF